MRGGRGGFAGGPGGMGMGRGGPGGPAGPEGFTLFVHGLAPEVKEGEIWQLFGPFGAINKVRRLVILRHFDTQICISILSCFQFDTKAGFGVLPKGLTNLFTNYFVTSKLVFLLVSCFCLLFFLLFNGSADFDEILEILRSGH